MVCSYRVLKQLAKEANMTRGAIIILKIKDLFLAVLEQIQIDTGNTLKKS